MKFQQSYRKTTSESRRCTQKSRVSLGPCQTYLSDLLSVLIHLSPTPRLFSILCGGQQGSTGPQGDKKQSAGELASSAPWRASNRADISKWNKTPLDATGITSPRRNAFCILVLVLLTTVCSRLSQTAAPKRLRSSWYLLAAPLWLALAPPEVPRCLAPSLPSPQPALLDAGPLKQLPSSPFFTLGLVYHETGTKLPGIAVRNKGNFRSFAGNIVRHWEKRFLRNCWPLSRSINPSTLNFLLLKLGVVFLSTYFANPRIQVGPFALCKPTHIFRLDFRLFNFFLEIFRLSKNSLKMLSQAPFPRWAPRQPPSPPLSPSASQLCPAPCLPEIFRTREVTAEERPKSKLISRFQTDMWALGEECSRRESTAQLEMREAKCAAGQDSFSLVTLRWKQEVFIKDFQIWKSTAAIIWQVSLLSSRARWSTITHTACFLRYFFFPKETRSGFTKKTG